MDESFGIYWVGTVLDDTFLIVHVLHWLWLWLFAETKRRSEKREYAHTKKLYELIVCRSACNTCMWWMDVSFLTNSQSSRFEDAHSTVLGVTLLQWRLPQLLYRHSPFVGESFDVSIYAAICATIQPMRNTCGTLLELIFLTMLRTRTVLTLTLQHDQLIRIMIHQRKRGKQSQKQIILTSCI